MLFLLLEEFSEAIFIILLFSVDPFEIYDNRPLKYGGKQKRNPVHGLINYIDTKAKCRHLKILTCKRTLRQVLIRVYINLYFYKVYINLYLHQVGIFDPVL